MIRTPLYRNVDPAVARERALAFAEGEEPPGGQPPARDEQRDGYFDKLVKYVPGELVATFTAITAASGGVDEFTRPPLSANLVAKIILLAFVVITPIYFWIGARSLPESDKPAPYFYILSLLAFLIWALAISQQARDGLPISAGLSEFLLATGAFAIPLIDEWLTTLLFPKPANGDGT